jgi:hypothetical protein
VQVSNSNGASEVCGLAPLWAEVSDVLQRRTLEIASQGCSKHCKFSLESASVPVGYIIRGEDSGFEDHVERILNFKKFEMCRQIGKELVYEAAKTSSFRNLSSTYRHAVFAAQGCLHNRATWGKVHDITIGHKLAIFSDCALGRLYRQGIDVSLPTLPYPRL